MGIIPLGRYVTPDSPLDPLWEALLKYSGCFDSSRENPVSIG